MVPVKTASPPSVDRAFTILEEVAQSHRGLRLREIAKKLGAPRSSTHSLLVALERRGYLQRNESSGRYRFGPKVFTLANAGLKGMALREISYPILAGLMRQTGLTVHMAIMDRDHAVLIEQIVPPPELAPMTWPGRAAGTALHRARQGAGRIRAGGAMGPVRQQARPAAPQREHHLLAQEVSGGTGDHSQAGLCVRRRGGGSRHALSRRSGLRRGRGSRRRHQRLRDMCGSAFRECRGAGETARAAAAQSDGQSSPRQLGGAALAAT